MRGRIRTDEYFEEILRKTEENIDRFSKSIEQAREQHGEDFRGVRNGYGILEGEYSKRFDIIYTLGKYDEMLPGVFAELLKYTVLTWNADSYSYWDLIKILSLAALKKTDHDNIDLANLLDELREAQIRDYLTDRLCGYLDPAWPYHCETFLWKNTFEPLKTAFEDPDNAVSIIDAFLQKRWMIIHKGAWWYGGHNNDKKPYYGYWAYECAAVVRILDLDDTMLNGRKWYPYDLVHKPQRYQPSEQHLCTI